MDDMNDLDSLEQQHRQQQSTSWFKHNYEIGDFLHQEYEDDDLGEYPPYVLCLNESMFGGLNFSTSSIFCNLTYPYMHYGERDYEEDDFALERVVSIIVPILFSIIFIVGLVGNALVVIVVASNAQMRTTTNFLILNLAISDLLFIIFCIPFTATDYVLSYWPFGIIWCKLVQYLIIVTAYASVNTLVLMSFDRYLAVVYPVKSISLRTERNTLLAIAIGWIVILVACAPVVMAHGLAEGPRFSYSFTAHHHICTFKQEYNQFIFQLIFMLTSYFIPLTIISFLYFTMLFRLWKSSSSSMAPGSSSRSIRGKRRVTRMIVIVVGVFAFCWCPIQIVLILKSLKLYVINDMTVSVQITSHVLGYMNSCVNPILYAFLSDNFRKGFRNVIQCDVRGNGVGGIGGHGTMRSGISMRMRRGTLLTAVGGGETGVGVGRGGANGHVVIKEGILLATHYENGNPGEGRNLHRLLQKEEEDIV